MVMNKFLSDYLEYFNNLEINEINKAKIKNEIVNNKRPRFFDYKKKLAFSIIVIFFSISSAFALNYIDKFNTLDVKIKNGKPYVNSDVRIDVNDDVNIESYNCVADKCSGVYRINDIEKLLNSKILKDDKLSNQEIVESTIDKYDGKILRLSFIINNVEYDHFYLRRFNFNTKTKYYKTEDNKLPFSNKYKTIFIEKINTSILVAEDTDRSSRICFDYDNFHYDLLIFFKKNVVDKDSIIRKYINSLV